MNPKLKNIVKKVFVGATTAISAAFLQTPGAVSDNNISPQLQKDIETRLEKFFDKDMAPKLILQKPADKSIANFVSHRSHRSHSSHRSHYSSYTQPKEEKKEKDVKDEENRNIKPSPKQNENRMMYELGSRTLQKGMTGTDVAEMQDLLKGKGYKISVNANYDEDTEEVVKKYQKDKNLDITGKVDVLTLYHLKKK